jgi:hypothetical protein
MYRLALVLMATLVLAAPLAGCGGGYTQAEAEVRCRSLNPVGPPGNDVAYADCVECFKECGEDCAIAESNPPQYNCQE